jgi:hypothetical protein
MDPSLYNEVKKKLLQIKSLCEYLGLVDEPYNEDDDYYDEEDEEENNGSIIYQVFKRLEDNEPIFNLEDKNPKKSKNSAKFEDYPLESEDSSDEEEE